MGSETEQRFAIWDKGHPVAGFADVVASSADEARRLFAAGGGLDPDTLEAAPALLGLGELAAMLEQALVEEPQAATKRIFMVWETDCADEGCVDYEADSAEDAMAQYRAALSGVDVLEIELEAAPLTLAVLQQREEQEARWASEAVVKQAARAEKAEATVADLLEALRALLKVCEVECSGREVYREVKLAARNSARAAITKAEGGA